MIPLNPGEPVIKPEPVEHRVLTDRNTQNPVSTAPLVKPEPVNVSPSRLLSTLESNALTPSRARARENSGTTTSNKSGIKSEPVDNVTGTSRSFPVPPAPYVKYNSHQEIIYTPEGALSAGSAMIKVVKEKVRHLEIGSKLRKDVWKKDLDKLSNATSPATLIAICGATGAGKSSVINALLNDTIVPTSGMRACTAVVTEISYKTGRSIEGDVAFLAHDEWKAELSVLLDDLVDENGNLRPQSSLRAEAAVAWQKVHAVYPNIPYDSLINLKPELIISKDPKIARMLGTTQKISCANSKAFGKEIAKYIDSKEKKRGKKDKKDKDKKDKSEGPAYWPLVKTVKVRCPADALSTGAVLVDLPGTADANAARSSIAQQYMQQCHCIWILAPITRAVDDKVAKDLLGQAFKTQLLMDGNYDTSTVTFAELNEIKQSLQEAKDRHKEAQTAISKLKKKIAKAQREKNGYCAKARNEYSRDSLKEDWRAGVREMDQEAAMERDAANFDPTFDMRDYAAIDLPTFTVSSRDYIRITKQVEGDGEPTCFTDVADTQIPALQEWTKSLTVSSRDRAARNFLTQLKTFTAGIESYLRDMNSVSAIDRVNLRQRWASDLEGQSERMSTPPLRDFYDGSDDENSQEIELANPNGVVGTLNQAFREIVDAIVGDLQNVFKVGLQEKMQIGSRNAAAAAVQTSDTFAAEMHWSTYRATLRRDGIFRRDLNAELSQPLTNSIANSWAKVFEQDLFSAFEQRAKDAVVMMIDKIEASAATGLKDRCRAQGALALEDANTTMKGIVTLVNETLQTKQKDVSRTLSPHIQLQLQESYALAMLERGIGSVARQKAVVHNEIKRLRNQLFQGASDLLMDGLSSAAEAVGDALHSSLWDLANKVEVAMSVLWEDVKSSKAQIEYRAAVVKEVQEVAQQIRLWVAAEQSRQH
ncbi:hypothetical protein FRC03_005582 [Tulasnella sp. 419]|nr:hypothetical protein FRC03_005582 [Tulasnella sp. 419]